MSNSITRRSRFGYGLREPVWRRCELPASAGLAGAGLAHQVWIAGLGVGPGQIEVIEQAGDLKDAIEERRSVVEMECDARAARCGGAGEADRTAPQSPGTPSH